MMDNDFPSKLGGSSAGFLKGYADRLTRGSINNTQLPTTGEYVQYQQAMRDGQRSPMQVDYGTFADPNVSRYDVAGNPFGSDFVIPGTQKELYLQPILPPENRKEINRVFPPRMRGDFIDITPGGNPMQLPPA